MVRAAWAQPPWSGDGGNRGSPVQAPRDARPAADPDLVCGGRDLPGGSSPRPPVGQKADAPPSARSSPPQARSSSAARQPWPSAARSRHPVRQPSGASATPRPRPGTGRASRAARRGHTQRVRSQLQALAPQPAEYRFLLASRRHPPPRLRRGPVSTSVGALRRAHARGPKEHSLQQHVDDFADAGHDGPPGAALEAEPEADLDLTRSDDAMPGTCAEKGGCRLGQSRSQSRKRVGSPLWASFRPAVVASGRIGTMMISGPSDDIVAQTSASWFGATSRGILSDQPLSLAVSGKDGPDSRYGSGQRRSGATGTFMTLYRRRPARSGDWLACTFIPARIEARCPHWQPWSSQHRARSRRGHISARKGLSAAAGVDHARHLLYVPTLSPSAAALEPLAIADKLMGYVYAVAHRPPNPR